MNGAVSVIGLGKLGTCMAAAMAERRFSVVGVDVEARVVEQVNSGQSPVHEPGLTEMLGANSDRIRATADYADAVSETDTTFIIVPTPSEPDGGFSLRYVSEVGEELGRAIREKGEYHLVVLTSTVLPGSTEGTLRPILEESSDGECGVDFGLCYSPQLIALGSVIDDFLNPDVVLLGEADKPAGDRLEGIYSHLFRGEVAIQRMAIPNAELAKIALNSFVTTKITFANMLAEMCERLPGGEIDEVTTALGKDRRIGPSYLSAGLGFGGPCFPRDNDAFRYWAEEVEAPAHLASSTEALNRDLGQRLFNKVRERCSAESTVAVLGLAYKAGTPVLEGSPSLQLATALLEHGIAIVAYDPLSDAFPRRAIDRRLKLAGSPAAALAEADVVVIANPDPDFDQLSSEDLPNHPLVVFDCWRRSRISLEREPGIEYIGLGLAGEAEATSAPHRDFGARITT